MRPLFRRGGTAGVALPGLGSTHLALPLPAGAALPEGCFGVAVDEAGRTRRIEHGPGPGGVERCWCVHPGPYSVDLAPFAAAPEIGLRTTFAVDSADPRVAQQRFDLYLASEAGAGLALDGVGRQVEAALAHELRTGGLELPPCTSFDEWNGFRAGFNQLLYTRFGVSVDDCVPVDLGETRDFAAMLLSDPAPAPEPPPAQQRRAPQQDDAAALRRLFLELPAVSAGLRFAGLPFAATMALLDRLDLVSLSAATMPTLGLVAPGHPLGLAAQQRRAGHSRRAAAALDEAWALLARAETAHVQARPALLDEANRIVANLEHACAARRAVEGVQP